MSDFMRRAKRLSNWFERSRHALAFDVVFVRVHKTHWRDPAMAAGVVACNLGREDCISVIERAALPIANHFAPFDRFGCLDRQRDGKSRLRRKINFPSRFKLIDCVTAKAHKISTYENQKSCILPASCSDQRDVTANRHET
jgi:hypothetical protein